MPDILSQGDDRERGPWPRRLAAAAVLALAVALGAWQLQAARHAPPRAAAAGAGATVTAAPDGLAGPALPWPGGLRLPASGPRPAWFSPGSGTAAPIGGLPPQRSGYEFTPVAGGWAVQAAPAEAAGCAGCAGPPRAVYFLAAQAQAVTLAGTAQAVAPAASAGALWLTSYPPGARPGTAAGTAREVSVTGRPLGPPVRLPAGYQVEQATGSGLLLAPAAPRPGAPWRLLAPGAPGAGRAIASVAAASATEVALTPPCSARCEVQVVNLATGRRVTAELPGGRSAVNAAFSQDGRFLAVEESFASEGNDGGQAVQLEVVSTASGAQQAVPGTWLSSDALAGFGWAASGDSLVAELSFTTKVQLMSWRPGAARLAVAAIRPQRTASLVLGGQYAA